MAGQSRVENNLDDPSLQQDAKKVDCKAFRCHVEQYTVAGSSLDGQTKVIFSEANIRLKLLVRIGRACIYINQFAIYGASGGLSLPSNVKAELRAEPGVGIKLACDVLVCTVTRKLSTVIWAVATPPSARISITGS